LVIVSERGRHDEASRRLVRAQAARASAAQSRITRARNREEREAREGPTSPNAPSEAAANRAPSLPSTSPPSETVAQLPLLDWLNHTPSISDASGRQTPGNANGSNRSSWAGTPGSNGCFPLQGSTQAQSPGQDGGRTLPLALPRGFAQLRQRISMTGGFVSLISRSACIDFISPGVEDRLNQLIGDLIMSSTSLGISSLPDLSHPVQGHFRIACTCLTIFQCQRVTGQAFATDPRYNAGLLAAWSEVLTMNQNALSEPKAAQASLWAIIIISVTTGAQATASFFHRSVPSNNTLLYT